MSDSQKIIILGAAILGLIGIFLGAASFYKSSEQRRVETVTQTSKEVLVRPYSPQLGAPDAKVTVVEFLDPECESCRAASPHVKHLLKKYEGKVKLVVRYAAFHHNSEFAIRVLEAARNQGKFSNALDVMFETQPEWGSHHNPQPERIFEFLPLAFVDVERIRDEMQDPAIKEAIVQDAEDGKTLGVRGTPTFFVNGNQVGIRELEGAIQREVEANY